MEKTILMIFFWAIQHIVSTVHCLMTSLLIPIWYAIRIFRFSKTKLKMTKARIVLQICIRCFFYLLFAWLSSQLDVYQVIKFFFHRRSLFEQSESAKKRLELVFSFLFYKWIDVDRLIKKKKENKIGVSSLPI